MRDAFQDVAMPAWNNLACTCMFLFVNSYNIDVHNYMHVGLCTCQKDASCTHRMFSGIHVCLYNIDVHNDIYVCLCIWLLDARYV